MQEMTERLVILVTSPSESSPKRRNKGRITQRNLKQIPLAYLFHFLSFTISPLLEFEAQSFKIISIFKMNMNLKFSCMLTHN